VDGAVTLDQLGDRIKQLMVRSRPPVA